MLHLVMDISIIVMTPAVNFGEFIQQALKDLNLHRVTLVHERVKLFENLQIGMFNLVVIDLDLEPDPAELISTLYAFAPELHVIALMEGNSIQKIATDEGMKINFLVGLFHLPVFLEILANTVAVLESTEEEIFESERKLESIVKEIPRRNFKNIGPAPKWLKDVQRTALQLARLSNETSAHAVLITRNESVWVYSGHLSQAAAEELAKSVWQSWSRDGGNDFAQYTHLEADNGEYLLYATGLGSDFVLALAFFLEIPFSVIRSQAIKLANRLAFPPQVIGSTAEIEESRPAESQYQDQEMILQSLTDESIEHEGTIFASSVNLEAETDLSKDRVNFMDSILVSIDVAASDTSTARKMNKSDDNLTGRANRAITPSLIEKVDFDHKVPEINSWLPKDQLNGSIPDHLMDTQPTPILMNKRGKEPEEIRLENLDPVTYARHNLTYACVLLPRLRQHYLVGSLTTSLNRWILQLCIAFGWRLEHLAIRPSYFHWVALVQPEISPAHMVQSLRDNLSQRIFVEFPQFARENPSGDYWAPGYLIINGRDPLSNRLLKDFINEVRRHQSSPLNPYGT
jgi:REP element-mobilizing transposase RayT